MSPAMDDAIAWCLTEPRTWAVVGCSPSPYRDSHGIAAMLIDEGHTVVPVNPEADEVLGRRCYPALGDVPGPVDVVDVFRRSDAAGAHVDEAIAIGARAVWLQLGVIDHDAAERARSAGLQVVMDRCPRIELPRLRSRGRA
jgi:predicted CoA-binding protein